MKAEISISTSELAEEIAKRVLLTLKPLLKGIAKEGNDSLMDVDTLSKYLGVTRQWIYQRVREKAIPHLKVGKFPRFKKKDIDLWLEEQHVPAVSKVQLPGKKRL